MTKFTVIRSLLSRQGEGKDCTCPVMPPHKESIHPWKNKNGHSPSKNDKIRNGAIDFSERFEPVMRELAQEESKSETADQLIEKACRQFADGYKNILPPKSIESGVRWYRDNLTKIAKAAKVVEHCDKPECPECNIKAYVAGKHAAREEIRSKLARQEFAVPGTIGRVISVEDVAKALSTD